MEVQRGPSEDTKADASVKANASMASVKRSGRNYNVIGPCSQCRGQAESNSSNCQSNQPGTAAGLSQLRVTMPFASLVIHT